MTEVTPFPLPYSVVRYAGVKGSLRRARVLALRAAGRASPPQPRGASRRAPLTPAPLRPQEDTIMANRPYEITIQDMDIAARTIAGEARGEPYEGQVAVGCVILNRWRIGMADSLFETCLQPYQFSCWNTGDPNRRYISKMRTSDNVYQTAMKALMEAIEDPLQHGPITHYHAESITPAWAKSMRRAIQIGRHIFYTSAAQKKN